MDLHSLHPYDIIEVEDLNYQFVNKDGIVYHIYFNPISELYPQLVNTYAFSIEPESNQPHTIDRRIAETVVYILHRFFANIENAMIMVCDTIDGKQYKRRNLFNRWFKLYDDGTMVSLNAEAGNKDYELLLSIYFKKGNPNKDSLVKGFNELLTLDMYELVI